MEAKSAKLLHLSLIFSGLPNLGGNKSKHSKMIKGTKKIFVVDKLMITHGLLVRSLKGDIK